MANKLIISSSINPSIDASETVDGSVYQNFITDKNVGTLGGTAETTYTDAKARKYVGDLDATSAAQISNDAAFNGSATTTGAAPTTLKAFAVRYNSKVGSPGSVTVTFGSVVHAILANPGEAVVVPFTTGAIASAKLHAGVAYSAGTTEANVTVILIGD